MKYILFFAQTTQLNCPLDISIFKSCCVFQRRAAESHVDDDIDTTMKLCCVCSPMVITNLFGKLACYVLTIWCFILCLMIASVVCLNNYILNNNISIPFEFASFWDIVRSYYFCIVNWQLSCFCNVLDLFSQVFLSVSFSSSSAMSVSSSIVAGFNIWFGCFAF